MSQARQQYDHESAPSSFSRRHFLQLSAIGLLGSALAACVAAPASQPAAAAKSGGPPSIEGQTGVLWGLQYDPHVSTYALLKDLFESKYKATLKVEPQDWPLETKLIAALSAGTQPDVLCIMGKVLIPLHVQKAILPLSDVVYGTLGVKPEEVFQAESKEAYTWGGEIYGVPTEANLVGTMVCVPVDDVKAKSLTALYPPGNGQWIFDSYEQMWDLAKKLQVEENGLVTKWGISSKGWDNQSYLGIVRSLLVKEKKDWWDQEAQKFNLNSEAGVEAMRLLAEAPVKMGIEKELDTAQFDAALAGKIELARGISNPALQQGRDVGVMYEIVGAPKVMADTMPSYVGEAGWGFAAPRKAKNLDLAVAFLQMMATEEAQRVYCKMYGGITAPAWKALLGKTDYYADPKPDGANSKAAPVMKHLGELTHFYGEGFGYPAEVDTIGAELCSKVRLGDMTAAQGAQAYQERCEAQFKQYQEDVQNS